jgi:hypothetical protein
MADDFLAGVLRQAIWAARGGPEAVVRLELELRQRWGGERPYIPKANTDMRFARSVIGFKKFARMRGYQP